MVCKYAVYMTDLLTVLSLYCLLSFPLSEFLYFLFLFFLQNVELTHALFICSPSQVCTLASRSAIRSHSPRETHGIGSRSLPRQSGGVMLDFEKRDRERRGRRQSLIDREIISCCYSFVSFPLLFPLPLEHIIHQDLHRAAPRQSERATSEVRKARETHEFPSVLLLCSLFFAIPF